MIKGSLQVNKGIYHVSFRIKDKYGKTKLKQLSTGVKAEKGNKRRAERRMQEILAQYDGVTAGDNCDMLLSDYIHDWIERQKYKLSITTYDGYMHMFKKHIEPYFKARKFRLKDVLPKHIEAYHKFKADEGLSPNTIIKHTAVIRTALQDAVKNGVIRTNPAALASRPSRQKYTPDFCSEEELKALWDNLRGTELEMPVYFALFFGLRRSEALGVKWSAIDFDKKILTIDCKVTRAKVDGKLKPVESNTMKTEASKSQYRLTDKHCEYLKAVKSRQQEYIRVTDEFIDNVCVNQIGELIQPDYVTHRFPELLKKYGLKHIRFHDLRHGCISLLANNPDFTMKQVQEYARHADFTLTANTYSHVNFSAKEAELDAITDKLM